MDAFEAYEASGLDGHFMYLEPGGEPSVHFPNGDAFVAPHDETMEAFLDRIERSKKAGRNLFFEEWEFWEPEPGVIY